MAMTSICPWLLPSSSELIEFVSSLNSNRLVFLLLNSLILLLAASSGALTLPNINNGRRSRRTLPGRRPSISPTATAPPSSPNSKRRIRSSSSDPWAPMKNINPSISNSIPTQNYDRMPSPGAGVADSSAKQPVVKPSPVLRSRSAGSYAPRASSAAMRHAWRLVGDPLGNDEDAAAAAVDRAEHPAGGIRAIRTSAGMDRPEKQYPIRSSVKKKHGDDGEADREEDESGKGPVDRRLLRSEPSSPQIESSPYKEKSLWIRRSASVNGSPTNKEMVMEQEDNWALSDEDLKKKFDDFIHKTKSKMSNAHPQH